MNIRLVEQHFAQLSEVWEKSRYNNYSDSNKKSYQGQLHQLFLKLTKEEDSLESLDEIGLRERKNSIDFFFKSLEFLDSSTLNLLPFEIVYCLETALNDWVETEPNHIIVTSLNNDINSFSFDPSLSADETFYQLLQLRYDISFPYRLVQINLPRYLVRDYLVNVVLYHELGHFIDAKYRISQKVHDTIVLQILNGVLLPESDFYKDLLVWFPDMKNLPPQTLRSFIENNRENSFLFRHIMEYFADLYAAQYISNCSGYYLGYVTEGQDFAVFTHPASTNRNNLVSHFLNGTETPFLSFLKTAIEAISGRQLTIRFAEIDSSEIDMLIPLEIKSEKEMHYLFKLGWNKWIEYNDNFEKANNFEYKLGVSQRYEIINSLLEKSIGNFIVKKSWDVSAEASY